MFPVFEPTRKILKNKQGCKGFTQIKEFKAVRKRISLVSPVSLPFFGFVCVRNPRRAMYIREGRSMRTTPTSRERLSERMMLFDNLLRMSNA